MKRVLFTAMMLVGICLSASAQKEALYYYSVEGMSFKIRNWIDRSAMIFYFDSDSEDEATMLMKNYKKNGNKETFDLVVKSGYEKGKKIGSITIVTDPDLKVAPGMSLKTQTVTENVHGYTDTSGFLTEAQRKLYDKMKGNGGSDAGSDGGSVVDKAKDKAKGLLNKGKNLFKKKK